MIDSISLWKNVVDCAFLNKAKFVLFFNKFDQLSKMLSIESPSSLYPEYKVKYLKN